MKKNLLILLAATFAGSLAAQIVSTTNGDITIKVAAEFNVAGFGAKGDALTVHDGNISAGSTTVTSASGLFTEECIGKVIWGLIPAGYNSLPKTTIASFVSATTITVTAAPGVTQANTTLIWGTDDTAAIQAAAAAADGVQPKGCVRLPRGGYVFSDLLFNQQYSAGQVSYSVIGEGSGSTIFYAAPGHALTNNVVFSRVANVNGGSFRGLTVQGNNITYSSGGGIIVMHTGSGMLYEDVHVSSFRNASGNMTLVSCPGSYTDFFKCKFEFSSHTGIACSGYLSTFRSCYSGNHGGTGADLYAGTIAWDGGVLDECGGTTVYLQAGAVLDLTNVKAVYAGYGKTAVQVDNGVFRSVNSRIRPWWIINHNNSTALKVGSAGVAQLIQTTLTGSGTGYGLDNAGIVEDGGNNTANTKSGTGSIVCPSL